MTATATATGAGCAARPSGTTSSSPRCRPLVPRPPIPTTLLLSFWALGFAVAAWLLCYALSVDMPLTLFVSGVALAGGLYLGPGGSRVRCRCRGW